MTTGTRSHSPVHGTAGAGAEPRRHGAAFGELRASARLALPVVAVQLGIMLMSTIDTAMLGHLSAEALASAAIAHLMGRFGTEAIAGHQVAMLLCSVSFMVPVGIAGAAMTRVGNAIGRADLPDLAQTAGGR